MSKKILVLIGALLFMLISGCAIITNSTPSSLTIEGKVLINDKFNNQEFTVQVFKEDTTEVYEESELDDNGNFIINITEDGNYTMTVNNTGNNEYTSKDISFTIENNELVSDIDFSFIIEDFGEITSSISIDSTISIQGIVEFPDTMNFVDIKVILSNEEEGKPLKMFMIDESGEFSISEIQDGIYYICAQGTNNTTSPWLKVNIVNSKIESEEKIILEIK
ncbi:hypothetical protein GC105_12260 [Alkalibaculum sp. M08DMB]|uniref:Carboxypeptidase regulatory-like domain-containing protein n=1 Tax=Alkalibaculum sporogenes TaxID=2655001 RepID=A0A6A7KBB9_9FIRM|nr:hypothetical protein [Alkalibaculum sporogenes]MPW26561.1 hypothetical protein [Alkalibaculum sporogenes]